MVQVSELTKHLDAVVQRSGGSIVLEAGHFYVKGGLDAGAIAGAQVAVQILGLLESMWGMRATTMLFVDDVINKESEVGGGMEWGQIVQSTIVPGAIATLQMMGFPPDQVVMESELIGVGQSGIARLIEKGLAKADKGTGWAKLKDGWVPLQGKAGMSIPSCQMLDACLYDRKLGMYGGAITVLPANYRDQQIQTRKIVQAITGVNKPNVLVLYQSVRGDVVPEYWGGSV